MLSTTARKRVERATVRVHKMQGQGVLVPGGFILTAAHCINWDGHGRMMLGDHFIEELVAGRRKLKACPVFVDPVSDIAALGPLDGQVFPKEQEAFDEFCRDTEPVTLFTKDIKPQFSFPTAKKTGRRWRIPTLKKTKPRAPLPAYVLTHKRQWIEVRVQCYHDGQHSPHVMADQQIEGGTSGGPVVTGQGQLLGVVSNASITDGPCDGWFPYACLTLPPWLLRSIQK